MIDVPLWVWAATVGGVVAIVAADLLVAVRTPHAVSTREAALWIAFYVALAAGFAVLLWVWHGSRFAGEFVAGYLTEYSLSVDNLFVFLLIMTRFAVPRAHQQVVLLYGIVLALVMRGAFIAAGAAVVTRFTVSFYVFGAFLVYTAFKLLVRQDDGAEFRENRLLRLTERLVPSTRDYHGRRVLSRVGGHWVATPLFVVMVAIGTTDLLFALDSIPAIFGLTKQAYIVFTANAFALMGLRQLYFLLHGLLNRLVYLNVGLSVVLGFIGVKLVLEAAHHTWPSVPDFSIGTSLAVIGSTLLVTTVASLVRTRGLPPAPEPVPASEDAPIEDRTP